jgi:hypothetical protein
MTEARCNFCGKSFRNRQAVRAHLRGCPDYRHAPKAAVPSTGSQPRTIGLRGTYPGLLPSPNSAEPAEPEGSSLGGRIQAERERLELRRLKDANRELEAKAQRREQAELARMLAEQAEREATQRRARADAAAQADQERRRREEERRGRETHEERVRTGKRLAEKAVETVPGLGIWDRLEIQRAATAALEKASDTEPIDTIVDRTISLQVRLLKPLRPAEPVCTPAAAVSPPAEAIEPDEIDADEIDEEPCDDPDCEDCNPSNARGSGWGWLLLLSGIATLAVAKHVADKRTATPSGDTPPPS